MFPLQNSSSPGHCNSADKFGCTRYDLADYNLVSTEWPVASVALVLR